MRQAMKFTMCFIVALGAAAPAVTASSDYFLKLGDVKGEAAKGSDSHKEQIEIASWSWGETRTAALTDGLLIIRTLNHPETASPAGGGQGAGKVNVHDISIMRTAPQKSAQPAPGGVRVAAGDVDGDGRADKFGAVSGMHRNDGIATPRDSASGMPTGKRQHGPVTFATPRDRGSVSVKGSFPGCRVGASYSDALLHNAAGRFELTDVVIAGCPTAASGDRPAESLSLNYAKVIVRAWDTKKKEE